MLRLEPAGADAEKGSSSADVIQGGDHLGEERGLSEGVGRCQQAESDPTRRLCPSGKGQVPLEDRALIADDREDVIRRRERLVAEFIGSNRRVEQVGPRRVHAPQVDAEQHTLRVLPGCRSGGGSRHWVIRRFGGRRACSVGRR